MQGREPPYRAWTPPMVHQRIWDILYRVETNILFRRILHYCCCNWLWIVEYFVFRTQIIEIFPIIFVAFSIKRVYIKRYDFLFDVHQRTEYSVILSSICFTFVYELSQRINFNWNTFWVPIEWCRCFMLQVTNFFVH